MKQFVFIIIAFAISFQSNGQNKDTLYENNLRKAADIIFQNLNGDIFGPSLLDRSLTSKKTTMDQLSGNYNQIHSVVSFVELYEDLSIAYIDSNYLMSPPQLGEFIINKFAEFDQDTTQGIDALIQPFGFLLHETAYIDTNHSNSTYFEATDFQVTPLITEDSLYVRTTLKSAALFEFYSDPYYEKGFLKYEENLISLSPNISSLLMNIDVGNGFVPFDSINSLIEYQRNMDSMIGKLAFEYRQGGELFRDTIQFYLTGNIETDQSKTSAYWDVEYTFSANLYLYFDVMLKRGCGNNSANFPRRPIIIVPPYRPEIQKVSSHTYYAQFNYGRVMDYFTSMGYDIYFLRLNPGYPSLEDGAYVLSEFIKHINYNKEIHFPNEDWETIVMGYSMGGQIARYALKKMEYDHMTTGTPHHHCRLYIPFDSPHHGVNIPMATQAVYYDYKNSNLFANLSYASLIDEASKDMTYYNIKSSDTQDMGTGEMRITPLPTPEAVAFQNSVTNSFLHPFSFPNDQRRSFPSFSRNIAISTGNLNGDYEAEYGLNPGKLLFEQDAYVIGLFNLQYKVRRLYSSEYGLNKRIYKNQVYYMVLGLFPLQTHYVLNTTVNALEFDMGSGGYKDEFYDKYGDVIDLGIIPLGSVSILRATANFWGNKYYDKHMMFLPTVSSLAIRKSIWENNALFYDLKGNGLMYKTFNFIPTQPSNTFGYPNLGRPADHFNITPFEAIYCDPQTYEHIKMKASVDLDDLDESYLVYLRNFLLDEVEADIVCLQNKVIGKNHIQTAGYKYRAWYKAVNQIGIGYLITPTSANEGDFCRSPVCRSGR